MLETMKQSRAFKGCKLLWLTKDSLDLLGMTIDSLLNFDEQVSLICKKVNNQLNVMIRFRKLVNTSTMLKLYKAFVLPHF